MTRSFVLVMLLVSLAAAPAFGQVQFIVDDIDDLSANAGQGTDTTDTTLRTNNGTVAFRIISTAFWLTVTPSSGNVGPGGVNLTIRGDATHLPKGDYQGSFLISATGATTRNIRVNISSNGVEVFPEPREMTFEAPSGALSKSDLMTVSLENGTRSQVQLTLDGPSWITIEGDATSFTTPKSFRFQADAMGIGVGQYTLAIQIRCLGGTPCYDEVEVTVVVNPPPISRAVSHLAAGGEWTTAILAVNTGNASATFAVEFFDDDGRPVALPFSTGATNKLTAIVPAHGTAYFEASNPNVDPVGAWGAITAPDTLVVQALFRRKVRTVYYEAAVPSSLGTKTFTVPFDATKFVPFGLQFYTGFALANLDPNQRAQVACLARDAAGAVIPAAVNVPMLAAHGHWAEYNFPALLDKRGTIECSSDTFVAATALRVIGNDAFSTLPVIDPAALAKNATPGARAVSHLAAGGDWTTGILAVNKGTTPAQFSIAFYDDEGKRVSLPFTSGATNQLSGNVPAQGSAYFEAADPNGPTVGAWGLITAGPNVVVQALFRRNVQQVFYEAAVPSSSGSTSFTLPFDATTFVEANLPFYTGFALSNLSANQPANVACTVRDNTGTAIPNAIVVPAIPPQGHWADYNFPALRGKRGSISCTSNTNVSSTALRVIGVDAISTLPIIGQ